MPVLDGIDVSHHQGNVDWTKVASVSPALKFVMARMTHGGRNNGNLRVDKKGRRNRDQMRAAFPHTPRGFYHFLGASDPQVQARHFKNVVGPLMPSEFLMLDVEPDEPAGVHELSVGHIAATLDAIEQEFGVTPSLYIGRFYTGSTDKRLHRYPLVLPAYTTEAKFKKLASEMGRPVMMWQWGGGREGATVPGITTGRVDSNLILDDGLFRAGLAPGGNGGPRPPVVTGGAHALLPDLGPGDVGNAVFILQTMLIAHGIFRDRDVNRDGKFEDGTRRGVERFQASKGLPKTGRVDKATWNALGFA